MADEEINYTKEVLASNPNMIFVGIMFFLMLAVNFLGFLPLLLAGEIGALFIAQHPRVQRIIRARKNKDRRIEAEEAETVIVRSLPGNYQSDYHSLRQLCDEIERRAHHLLSTRNYRNIEMGLSGEISRVEKEAARESSPQVRKALEQNLNVLKQRLARVRKLDELVRLLEAR